MRPFKALAWCSVAVSLLAACGDDSPAGGGGSGGDGTGATGATGGTNTGGATGGGGDGAGGGFCDEYTLPLPPVQTVPVTVVNNTAAPIYLGKTTGDCSTSVGFTTETLAGQPVKAQLEVCEMTCEELVTGSCGCAADCALPFVVMVHPGGSYELSWTAIVYNDVAMPASCYGDGNCVAPTCPLGDVPGESLRFLVDGYSELGDCAAAPCTCDGGVAGSCTLTDATIVAGAATVASGEWAVSDTGVTITFQ